jgi:hypothetical protein
LRELSSVPLRFMRDRAEVVVGDHDIRVQHGEP